MTFPGDHKKVLSGRRSEARVPVKDPTLPCRWRVGNDYKLPGGKGMRVRVLGVEKQRLGDIPEPSVRREGFKTLDEFKETWIQQHGAFDPETQVWVVVFVPFSDPARLMHSDASKPPTSNAEMALGAITGKSIDKRTGRRIEIEPEMVDEETEVRLIREAKTRFDGGREDELVEMQYRVIATKLIKLQRRAMRHGVDIAPQLQQFIRERQAEIAQMTRDAA